MTFSRPVDMSLKGNVEMTPKVYGLAELSEITGMSTSTLSTLLHRSRRNRAKGLEFPNDIPEPDVYFGLSPTWHPDTIRTWLVERAFGKDSVRVKKPVDPYRSLEKGRAVPLTPDERRKVSKGLVHRIRFRSSSDSCDITVKGMDETES